MNAPRDAGTIRVRMTRAGADLEVRALIEHPMETGRRKDETGAVVPARYIETVSCTLDGEAVLTADWGPGVARNPSLSFTIRNIPGPSVLRIGWRDNQGDRDDVAIGIPAT